MLKILGSILLILLAIIGLVEIFRIIILIVFREKDESSIIITIPIKGHNEKAEYLIRSAIAKIKWFGSMSNQKIICIDKGMDHETRKICEIFKKEYEFIKICFEDEVEKILKYEKEA